MATYNGERFLPEMLESLAAQTRLPDELVVRDDASEDGTLGVLREFAGRARFEVTVIPGDRRLGYAQNFVTATRACSGDLVFFADQDDTWRPAKIAVASRGVQGREPLALFHDFALQADDGSQVAPSVYAVLEERGFSPMTAVNGCSMAVTRGFIELWGWPPPASKAAVSHDAWVAILSTAFRQRRNLDEVLIDYRLHDDNASGWIPSAEARQFIDSSDEASETEILIDLLVKKRKVGPWTRVFLDVLDERGADVDPAATRRLVRSLKVNRRRHRQARAAAAALEVPRP